MSTLTAKQLADFLWRLDSDNRDKVPVVIRMPCDDIDDDYDYRYCHVASAEIVMQGGDIIQLRLNPGAPYGEKA